MNVSKCVRVLYKKVVYNIGIESDCNSRLITRNAVNMYTYFFLFKKIYDLYTDKYNE